MSEPRTFKVGIDFEHVLAAISKQIYETPLAFIRENAQNAVDAVKLQALRENGELRDMRYRIDIGIDGPICRILDYGNGMSTQELEAYFWTIGASGKRNEEAKRAGCVGMFGIGGFANFGVCSKLEVISQSALDKIGTSTILSEEDIKAAGSTIPEVRFSESQEAAPRGTIVLGTLRHSPNVDEVKIYLRDFVRYR